MDESTRRQVLGGTAALLGLSAGCQGLFEGDDGITPEYGTPDQSLELLDTKQAIIGSSPAGRPMVSNGHATIYVDPDNGDDSASGTEDNPVQSIQTAVRRVPLYLRHKYTIDLETVPETPVSYDEDVLVPTIIGSGQAGQEDGAPEAGPIQNLVIQGSKGDPSAVNIGSVMFANLIGTSVGHLQFVTLSRDSPYDDEEYALSAYGAGEIQLYSVVFTGGSTNGILAYGSKMKASNIDFGQGRLSRGIHAKRHGSIVATNISGEVTNNAYLSTQNSTISIKPENNLSGSPMYQARVGGQIYDEASSSWTGLTGSREGIADMQSGGSSLDVGEIWYEDGGGDSEEGFYGQTADGPTRLG